jgi:uncharacterized protein YdeI (YjbR/CyaY-like superfamily)
MDFFYLSREIQIIMTPVFFKNQADLRIWFEKFHQAEKELWVGYYKVETKKESVTWSQSVDEAICFGWIDGIRKSIDQERYCIRFTPRRPGSNWSRLNISKAETMIRLSLMHPDGLKAYSIRKAEKGNRYSYESSQPLNMPDDMKEIFRHQDRAWKYFMTETPSYRKIAIRWVSDAKQEVTRLNRLQELITSCAAGKRIKAVQWGKKKKAG